MQCCSRGHITSGSEGKPDWAAVKEHFREGISHHCCLSLDVLRGESTELHQGGTHSSAAGIRHCHQTCPVLTPLLNHDRHVFEHRVSQGCDGSCCFQRQLLQTGSQLEIAQVWLCLGPAVFAAPSSSAAGSDCAGPRHPSSSELLPSLCFLCPHPV